ncbi:MAG: sulfotransferase domain-containing protein [Candidatus Competibacteraceae bacterium]
MWQIADCPVENFWKPHPNYLEPAIEGHERISNHRCWKSHHIYEEFSDRLRQGDLRLIYVVRDPRDIVISGAHYFYFDRAPRMRDALKKLPMGLRFYNAVINSMHYKLLRMTETVMYGCAATHVWCAVPWAEHVCAYLDASVFTVRYEDMLDDPLHEATRIAEYLKLSRSEQQLKNAISRQSFDTKKKALHGADLQRNSKILREGRSGQWKEQLQPALASKLTEHVKDIMKRLDYV